jgi:hypothetical protein
MGTLEKARLIEMEADKEKPGGKKIWVQFNPDAMKVTFANQIVQPQGGDQSSGNTGRQFVGAGTTKLALTLWFDVTAMVEKPVDDVRRLTTEVIYFMTPQEDKDDPKKLVPPGIRFSWGSFLFDGTVEGLEESLEFFSEEGKPLRASVALTLSQQKILVSKFGDNTAKAQPGLKPLTPARAGDSVQSVAASQGKSGGDWRGVAAANGIEDPLRLQPGQLLDLNAKASASATLGLSAGMAQAGLTAPAPRLGLTSGAARIGLN